MQQVRRDRFEPAIPFKDRRPAPSPAIEKPRIKPVQPFVPQKGGNALALRGSSLPVRVFRRRSFLVSLGHLWVLHRRLALRVIALMIVMGVATAGYVFRDEVRDGARFAADLATGQAVQAGFGVAAISITGQSLTSEADIVAALGIDNFATTFTFDAEAARRRIEEIPSVESATIRKVYPDSITVTIAEKDPVARWRMDGRTFLVDAQGARIASASIENGDLTLVIGEGAADDALAMINLMERYPALTDDLAALSRIGDRRWDLIFYTGLRVQLPETGVAEALDRLVRYHSDHLLLDRDLDLIDMRIPQYVAVRPTVREEDDS